MQQLTLQKETNVAASPGFATDAYVLYIFAAQEKEKRKRKGFFTSWGAKLWVRCKFGKVIWNRENGTEMAFVS